MSAPPVLFDPEARRARQRRCHARPVTFLAEEAAEQLQERLIEVNRTFHDPVVIGPEAVATHIATRTLPTAAVVAEAETLPLAEGSADLAVHALALHAAADPVGQLVQMRRALRPDGLALAVTVGGRTLHELRAALAEAEIAVRGGLSPRVAPMGDLRDYGALLQRASFALPVADSFTLTVSYPDLAGLVRDLRGMGETNALAARDRRPPPRALFQRAEDIYRASFGDADGRLPATVELIFLTGWAPAPSQPQPLRPGSAKTRLADALGTEERPAGDSTPRRGD